MLENTVKILHVFAEMSHGGAEMRTLDIMRHVDRKIYRLEFCSLSGKSGDLNEEVLKLGGKIHLCRLGPLFPWRFVRLLRKGAYDVVHCHVHLFSGYLLRLAHKCGTTARIAHFRSTCSGHSDTFRYRVQCKLMRRWIDGYATHIFGVGKNALSSGWDAAWEIDSRCAVIHNGLDASPFYTPADPDGVRREFGWPMDCPVIIHVGRMVAAKNHPRLIEIVGRVMQQDPSVRLLLVGKDFGDVKQRLMERMQAWKLDNRVAMAGDRSDVPRLLQAADLMVFPSLWEGLPGAVLEACAAGLPVLASRIPAILEIASQFSHVRCMSLEESDDRWAEMAQALIKETPGVQSRENACRKLISSRYGIQRAAKAHEMAWLGMPSTEIRKFYA